jgi:RimJ/RimL family protein N-acetyltransferase
MDRFSRDVVSHDRTQHKPRTLVPQALAPQTPGASVRKYSQLPKLFRWFSEHCVLRAPEESDVMHIWNAVTHPQYTRCWTGPVPRILEDVAALVQRALGDWTRGTRYALAVQRKSTQEFVGWIELLAHASRKGAWLIHGFIHPRYIADPIAREALVAAAELMFNTLDAQALYAQSPAGNTVFEQLLNEAGFIEVAPAGSLDAVTQRPRAYSLFELGREDWAAMRRLQSPEAGATATPTAPSWINSGLRRELALL